MNSDFRAIDEADGPDCWTRYHGRRVRLAAFFLNGERLVLSLGDTHRCAQDAEACRATLRNLAYDDAPGDPAAHAFALQAHCQRMTDYKEKPKRDVQKRAMPRRYVF